MVKKEPQTIIMTSIEVKLNLEVPIMAWADPRKYKVNSLINNVVERR